MDHVLNALEICGTRGELPPQLNGIIDTLLMFIKKAPTLPYNTTVEFIIRILCNELLHNQYPPLPLCAGIETLIQKNTHLKAKVVYCLTGFGATAQCRLCLFRQHAKTRHMCVQCSGVFHGDNYQVPVQPFACVRNAVTLLNRVGFYELWHCRKNESYGSHTKVFEQYYYTASALAANPEYLAVVKAVCAHDGDGTAFRVCLGYTYSPTQLDSPTSWQPLNRCLQRWHLNRTVAEVVYSYLTPSKHFQQLVNRDASATDVA